MIRMDFDRSSSQFAGARNVRQAWLGVLGMATCLQASQVLRLASQLETGFSFVLEVTV